MHHPLFLFSGPIREVSYQSSNALESLEPYLRVEDFAQLMNLVREEAGLEELQKEIVYMTRRLQKEGIV